MIHTCLKEVMMVYFTGVLQVNKKTTLFGISIARHMEETIVAKELQPKYCKVGFDGQLYLTIVSYMYLHAPSET